MELLFGWPHLRGLELDRRLVTPLDEIVRTLFHGCWVRLMSSESAERFLWLVLYGRIQDKANELTMCVESGGQRARLLYRDQDGDDTIEFVPDGIVPAAIQRLLYRAEEVRTEGGVVRGKLAVRQPRAMWSFEWNSDAGRICLQLENWDSAHEAATSFPVGRPS